MLISVREAASMLGLKSRNSIYRKINSGQLQHTKGSDGAPLIESEGLAERWANITQSRGDSPVPRAKREAKPRSVVDRAPESVPAARAQDEELPDYSQSRARSEFERANLLELERKQKEGLLLPADQVQKVWANSVTIARTKLLAIPTRLRQRIPHLSLEEIAIAEELIRESLEELSASDGGDGDGL